MRRRDFLAATVLAFAALSCASCQKTDTSIAELRAALENRLLIMPRVASYKFSRGLAVEDKAREQIVVARFVEMAAASGIDEALATVVIAAQISSAKALQNNLIAEWRRSGGPTEPEHDLVTEIRPMIDSANDRLITALVQVQLTQGDCPLLNGLRPPPSSLASWPDVWEISIGGFFEFCPRA